jgi:prepilin-type N-terminal cleavage/methylation domain-containing protein
MKKNSGFTLMEMAVVLAVVAILVGILVPTVAKHIRDSQITRASNEVQVIAAAVMMLYKDTGKWPSTNADGPAGGVSRVLTGEVADSLAVGVAPGARTGAVNWGSLGPVKQIRDYLYYNNPDDDAAAAGQNQVGQDYPISGDFAWRGPYIDRPVYLDPWGRQYVVNARYFPGNTLTSTAAHRVLVLSSGVDGLWSTPFSDGVNRLTTPDDSPYGPYANDGSYVHDDIGIVLTSNN